MSTNSTEYARIHLSYMRDLRHICHGYRYSRSSKGMEVWCTTHGVYVDVEFDVIKIMNNPIVSEVWEQFDALYLELYRKFGVPHLDMLPC